MNLNFKPVEAEDLEKLNPFSVNDRIKPVTVCF